MVVSLTLVFGCSECSQRRSSASQEPKSVQQAGEHGPPAPSVSATSPLARSVAPEAATEAWPPPPPAVETSFCIEGIDALDESTCYILPDEPSDELLIYLHGTLPPTKVSPQKTSFQSVVKAASRRAGVQRFCRGDELDWHRRASAGGWDGRRRERPIKRWRRSWSQKCKASGGSWRG
jgi:hypothetical protein